MKNILLNFKKGIAAEVIFQVLLHLLVFLMLIFDKRHPEIQVSDVAFFMSYALGAFIINYVFIPLFLYKKKYIKFIILVIILLLLLVCAEEFVLEKIFFPNSRGSYFSGFFFTLIEIAPSTILICGFKLGWDALKKQQELEKLQGLIKESELQYLKSQINPHFLFNNLNNLYSYAIEKSPIVPEIILNLSSVLRYMLYNSKENSVPLSDELEHLSNFIELNKLQFEDRAKVTFKKEGVEQHHKIVPLILIMFVENAFKHSSSTQTENINIDVIVKVKSNKLKFVCTNSFLKESSNDYLEKGIGLLNVKKRLKLLYPNAHKLEIDEKENTFMVKLSIDLNKLEL